MARRPTLEALLKFLTADMQSAFLAAIQGVVDQVILNEVVEAVIAGDADRAFELLGFNPGALRPITAAIERMYERAGEWANDGYPRLPGYPFFRFNVRDPRAENWIREKSSSLITRITEDVRDNVRNTLTDGITRGVNPRNTALNIVGRVDRKTGARVGGAIGLTPHQENWTRSFRMALEGNNPSYFDRALRDKRFDGIVRHAIETGKPLGPATIEKLVVRYRSNALRLRGETIARTESIASQAAAELESARQVLATGAVQQKDIERVWDSAGDRRVRPEHRAMDGQTVGLDEPFKTPDGTLLMHPGDTSLGATAADVVACRCVARTKINWLGV